MVVEIENLRPSKIRHDAIFSQKSCQTALNFSLYIYITDFVFQNLAKFGGGGNLTLILEISAGKVRNGPQRVNP